MAPAPTYLTPARQMVELAHAARARGLSFDEWWAEAVRPGRALMLTTSPVEKRPVGCVLWPSDSYEARIWREATHSAKAGWQLEPSASERALIVLGPALMALASDEPVAA
jgi:hypothetical protein